MTIELEELEAGVEAQLARAKEITPELIRIWIARYRVMFTITDQEAEQLAKRLETRHDVTMRFGSQLTGLDFTPWLEPAKAGIDWYYWERYRRLLREHMKLSRGVIDTIHAETERTLGLLENPHLGTPWQRRGMVVGYVQSGKTANYVGLIAKAADAGYKVIVVIAGVHNNLRNQTQVRVDEGFIGRDSARLLSRKADKFIGVGKYDPTRRPVSFTNAVKDFDNGMATGLGLPLHSLSEPAVFVIKKNYHTLKNLTDWMQEHNGGSAARALPLLLIDDEADNASINVKYGKGEVTRINGQIRTLLKHFDHASYVGYTATPFANIFIDPDTDDEMLGAELFPRDFIVSLDPPSNYFGAATVFGAEAKRHVRYITDSEDTLPVSHPKTLQLETLPGSMVKAVRAFCVARAIRRARGHTTAHCSMLVNASRFTDIQGAIRGLVQQLIDDIGAGVRLNAALPAERALRDPEMEALHQVWQAEYAGAGVEWAAVQAQLVAAVSPIKVVEVNSRSHGTLNYADYEGTGMSVIAVGGYSLSRGLTLSGLMVSYFLRNSVMYDTLMQMGRWFGYRPEYEDLCRVWMPEEAEGWYAHVAESIDLLREELRIMAAANATPADFGLKVRSHPDTLMVTARNKMGAGEKVKHSINLAKTFVETAALRRDDESRSKNRDAAVELARQLAEAGFPLSGGEKVSGGYLLRGVPVDPILGFLASFRNSPASLLTEPGPVGRYIQRRKATELARWDVFFASTNVAGAMPFPLSGVTIRCQRRREGNASDSRTVRVTNKQRVASRGIEKTGLDAHAIEKAERDHRLNNAPGRDGTYNYPDAAYRLKRTVPLLIVHLLDMTTKADENVSLFAEPTVAWSLSFPKTETEEEPVEYIVTRQWQRENMPVDDDLDDEDDDL
jgi:hypothetical protein